MGEAARRRPTPVPTAAPPANDPGALEAARDAAFARVRPDLHPALHAIVDLLLLDLRDHLPSPPAEAAPPPAARGVRSRPPR